MLTWDYLCSEVWYTAICFIGNAAEQDNGVWKREGNPSRVIISRLAVIVFDKDDDCEGLLFVDILSSTNIE